MMRCFSEPWGVVALIAEPGFSGSRRDPLGIRREAERQHQGEGLYHVVEGAVPHPPLRGKWCVVPGRSALFGDGPGVGASFWSARTRVVRACQPNFVRRVRLGRVGARRNRPKTPAFSKAARVTVAPEPDAVQRSPACVRVQPLGGQFCAYGPPRFEQFLEINVPLNAAAGSSPEE